MNTSRTGNIIRVGDAEAEVILHSVVNHPDWEIPLITVRTRYWRAIHSELMTHRVFSRNARSSRAVPTKRLLKEDPFIPQFGMDIPGMQAGDQLTESAQRQANAVWTGLIETTRANVQLLTNLGVHKQWANRPLEWFGWIDTLITATDWTNFYALRDHRDAAPEIQDLTKAIKLAIESSTPTIVNPYQDWTPDGWHLPYILEEEKDIHALDTLKIMSTARCARISYTPFDTDKIDKDADVALFEKLCSNPVHASPPEHVATPDLIVETQLGKGATVRHWAHPEEHGNFYGWRQFRKMIPNEATHDPHYFGGVL